MHSPCVFDMFAAFCLVTNKQHVQLKPRCTIPALSHDECLICFWEIFDCAKPSRTRRQASSKPCVWCSMIPDASDTLVPFLCWPMASLVSKCLVGLAPDAHLPGGQHDSAAAWHEAMRFDQVMLTAAWSGLHRFM